MTAAATTGRVLRLLALLQRRPSWTAAELAAELGVTDRSVRRDVERLRAAGYLVHAAAGAGGGYRLGAGTRLPPLLFDEEEAIAAAVSLRLASGGTVAGAGEAALRALAKLGQVRELVPPQAGRVEDDRDGWCVLVAGGEDLDWLAMHVARLGFQAEVQEPPELREAAARLARRLTAMAGTS